MRWQRFMILVTIVLSTLLVAIWCVRAAHAQYTLRVRA
jgi:hypothetical protein